MTFVRQLDWTSPEIVLPQGYKGKFLYSGEDCHVVATLVPPGASGPPQHKHSGDQIYVIVSGTITIQLGGEERTAVAGETIFIPAGLPHHNWNDGESDEIHIEVIAPGVLPVQPLAVPADGDTDDRGLPYFVKGAASDGPTPEVAGITHKWLVTREDNSEHATIYLTSVQAGTNGTQTRINAVHEFYYVTEGTLSTEIALERYDVTAGSLVSIPAGVPHRFWNEGQQSERHITILAPSVMSAGEQLPALAVTLTATSELDKTLAAI
ncbi:MAG TPA: cupin domain-containing protein [Solirubrobacteraceae bacterium]|nr:cupin domain-containing protein [Solirubrobacteraceae bacterium]